MRHIPPARTYLLWGALLTGAAAVLHVAIIIGGPEWYRFFGAFLARGLLGVPVVMLAEGAYAEELRARMGFMVASSLVCLMLGGCYAMGLRRQPMQGTI